MQDRMGPKSHKRKHELKSPKDHSDVDPSALGDDKILVYKTATGKHHYEVKGAPSAHASTHEVDGTDLVRPYLPVAGVWRITGTGAPFALEGDDEKALYVEGLLYFDTDTGKMKVTA